MNIQPVTLIGRTIRLEPMSEAHLPGLCRVGLDERIWRLMVYGSVQTEADLRAWMRDILSRQAAGTDLAFTVVLQATGQPIGNTRFMNIAPKDRGVEIGGTWYGADYQGTAVNPEAKLLLMSHAFEVWQVIRVQLKTDVRNERSQRAIEKLGAVREGVLRNHMILPDGSVRSSVIYSVIDSEWPGVKAGLEARLGSGAVQPGTLVGDHPLEAET